MDKRVVLAVAGAGKTYSLCHNLNVSEKNLIIAFTNQNIFNIKRELIDAYGKIPARTKVMTFHSFIYQFFICPYEPTILKFFGIDKFCREGVSFRKPPEKTVLIDKIRIPNKKYYKKDQFEHYVYANKYYCGLMSELLLIVKNKKFNLIKRGSQNLMKFFEHIYVDEFQDFREYDYEFLMSLAKNVNQIMMVGDYYQHSVSGQNNSGKPFKKGKNYITHDEYLAMLKKLKFTIDTKSLCASRRCPKQVCKFIWEKLDIKIEENNCNKGNVIFVKKASVDEILNDDDIKKIVFANSEKFKFNAINWGYSKGDTYDNICVILTEAFEDIDSKSFKAHKNLITVNKLYVALSRTRGNLYILQKSVFDLVKNKYLI